MNVSQIQADAKRMQVLANQLTEGVGILKIGHERICELHCCAEAMHNVQGDQGREVIARFESLKSLHNRRNQFNPNKYRITTDQYRQLWGRK